MTRQKLATVVDKTRLSDGPYHLPYAAYPKAADTDRHGLQPLPESLPPAYYPFLDTVVSTWEPVYSALGGQDAEDLAALSERYTGFREAYEGGKVGHHLLVARSDDLPKEDAFELVAASAERLQDLGYEYMVTEATNQWTGAAFEALGGVWVHFAPFLPQPAVHKSAEPLEGVTTSPNGFLSDKDSGVMFYVIRLA